MKLIYSSVCILFIGSFTLSCSSKKTDPVLRASIQHEYEDSLQTELNSRMDQHYLQSNKSQGYRHPSLPEDLALKTLQRYFNRFQIIGSGYEFKEDGHVSFYISDTLRFSFNAEYVQLDTVRSRVLLPNGQLLFIRCMPMFISNNNNKVIKMADGASKTSQSFGINNDCPCSDTWTEKDKYYKSFTLQNLNRFLSYKKAYNDYKKLIGITD